MEVTELLNQTHIGDCRELLAKFADAGVRAQTCVTSPPYFGLRDYGVDGQLGLEASPQEYVENMVEVFRLVRDVLADDGTLWLNLGDSYFSPIKGSGGSDPVNSPKQAWKGLDNGQGFAPHRIRAGATGCKPKDLIGIPWRVAFALQADGWYLRSDIIWHKPNPMPESVTDRPTKAHEYLFLLAKSERYYFDADAIKERSTSELRPPAPGAEGTKGAAARSTEIQRTHVAGSCGATEFRNRRTVWSVPTQPFSGAHFATFPRALIEPCILAGSRPGDVVLDPFMGSGTTAQVATDLGRQFIGCELNPKYVGLHEMRRTTIGMAI